MQARVARQVQRIVTVSESSRRDIADQLGVAPERMTVVPVGVDGAVFRPMPGTQRVPGRIMTTASSDVPMKGLVPLLEALAKVRTERQDAHLVVIGRLRDGSTIPAALDRFGLAGAVRFLSGLSDQAIVDLYAEAEIAVVPSLYEGFSLPAIEAMACGVPLIATTGGALPEVTGPSGVSALLVPPNDPGSLAQAILTALGDPALRRRLGTAGRKRTSARFTWPVTARATAEQYFELLAC
jgi:glycosyltransferase involved in cell wall biosynthesis